MWPGVEIVHAAERTNYPLAMAVDDLGSGFLLTAQSQAPVDPSRVSAYLHTAMRELIDALDHAPKAAIATLKVLPAFERKTMLHDWTATTAPFMNGTLDNLFAEQRFGTPDALAVLSEQSRR